MSYRKQLLSSVLSCRWWEYCNWIFRYNAADDSLRSSMLPAARQRLDRADDAPLVAVFFWALPLLQVGLLTAAGLFGDWLTLALNH